MKLSPFARSRLGAAIVAAGAVCVALPLPAADPTPATATPNGTPPSAPGVDTWLAQARQDLDAGDYQRAASEASAVLGEDPKNIEALELRATAYLRQKIWERAERDFITLNQLSPAAAYRYQLAEIRFKQRDFSNARPRYAALQSDPGLGDLCTYKLMLCDIFSGRDAVAQRDIDAASDPQKPSYYFCRAAWALFHSDRAGANQLIVQASKQFKPNIMSLYVAALWEIQRFVPEEATFTAKNGQYYEKARISLEEDGLRVSAHGEWKTIPIDQLPDDLSPFPTDLRDQIARRRTVASLGTAAKPVTPITFTTTTGKTYNQVRWKMEDSAVDILTDNGWVPVPLNQLPADLSAFPPELREAVTRRRAGLVAATGSPPDQTAVPITFTTTTGKTYSQVRWSLDGRNLNVLTENGWTAIPVGLLPADLSAFPPELRDSIANQRKAAALTADRPGASVVSFTTRSGHRYDGVRASLTDSGVMVLTPDGWVTVPFGDLPKDLSPFPAEWCVAIKGGAREHRDDSTASPFVTFTSRRGRTYDGVRASLSSEGLRVLTEDGWIVVPYDQLPDDLSPFPEAWRERIARGAKAPATAAAQHP